MSPLMRLVRRGPWRDVPDRDLVLSIVVVLLVCAASGGLLFVFYLARTVAIALGAPTHMARSRTLLVFGKRLQQGRADADFLARIRCAHAQLSAHRCERVLLLGGASEATVAAAELRRLGAVSGVDVLLEQDSSDTFENLRNARRMLATPTLPPVALLSSRYHLPRCAWLARQLGFDSELVAADARFVPSAARLRRLVLEAAYILWLDLGTRWARLTGNRRMLQHVA